MRRTAILGGAQALAFAVLSGRLYQLQVLDPDRYRMLADENCINLRFVAPLRGRVLDRFGIPLADNQQNYHLVVVPEQVTDMTATLDALAKLVGLDDVNRNRVLLEVRRQHPFIPIVVRDNLSWEQLAAIEVAALELPGNSIEQGLSRHYPYGDVMAHVVGCVAAVAEPELDGNPLLELPDCRVGKAGVEKAQDIQLRGQVGTRQVEVNAFGSVVRDLTLARTLLSGLTPQYRSSQRGAARQSRRYRASCSTC
jgi:penicillin-binding protein 2